MNNFFKILGSLLIIMNSFQFNAQVFSDNATNYGGSWINGSNQGTGFGNWALSYGSSTGSFIADPSGDGMGTSGIGTTAFAMYATGSGYFNATRSINNGLQVGDVLTFYWAINYDAGGGAKGFDLRAGGTTIFNVNNGGSSIITTTNSTADTNYGTTPMLVTVTRTSVSAYSFTMTSRSGGATYSTTINSSATIDGFSFYIGNQNDGAGQKNMYINAFTVEKPITIANGDWNTSSTWLNSTIPPVDATVTIDHNVTLNTNVTLSKLTINSGKTFTASDSSPRTITFNKSTSGTEQTLINNGTWANGTGLSTVSFSGSPSSGDAVHQITGTNGFQNILIEKTGGASNVGASFGSGSVVSGTLEIGNGGYVATAPPSGFYDTDAILKFDQGASANYDVNPGDFSWSSSEVPNNITISSGTVSLNSDRSAPGNLLIDGGSLNLNATTLTIQGNWTRSSGTLNAGTSTVIFSGSQSALFTVASESNLYNLTINKISSAVTVTLDGDVAIGNSFTVTNGTFEAGTNTISYNGTNQTIASSVDGVNYGNLKLSGSGTKTFSGNTTINGNFTVTDATVVAPTTLTFAGSSAQNLAGINYNNIVFEGNGNKTFTSNGQINSDSNITFGTGSGTIDFDGNANDKVFTFKSDVNNTAAIGNVGSFTLSGNVTTERYTKARRAYRFLTSPVTTSTTINGNWQEGQSNPNTATINNSNVGFGTQITGAGGSSNGFDTSSSNSASMFGFDNDNNTWTAVTNTNVNTLFAGVPYRILVRGDRSISLASNAATATETTLRSKGTFHTGDYTVSATVADAVDKYTFLGNPYQAPVNMESVLSTATGVNANFIYVWNSNLSTRGAYETIDVTTADPLKYVQPGQSFFVQNTTTTPSITFTESHKSVSNVDETIFRLNTETENDSFLKIQLYEATSYSLGEVFTDKLTLKFGNYSNEIDLFDAKKFNNPDEEFSSKLNDTLFAYQSRTLPANNEIIPLNIKKYRHQNYLFAFDAISLNNTQVFLEDTYLNTLTEISNSGVFLHAFSVNDTDTASKDENRFKLVFQQDVLSQPDFDAIASISVYPNPSKGQFSLNLPQHDAGNITIYNILGQQIFSVQTDQSELFNIDLTFKIPTGTYILKAVLDQKSYQKQIVIE